MIEECLGNISNSSKINQVVVYDMLKLIVQIVYLKVGLIIELKVHRV